MMLWSHMLLAAILICIASAAWFYGPDAAIVCAAAAFFGACATGLLWPIWWTRVAILRALEGGAE